MKKLFRILLAALLTAALLTVALLTACMSGPDVTITYGAYERPNGESTPIQDSFTITLNRDGTYYYYETMLSSHIGSGTYTVDGDTVVLTEIYKNIWGAPVEDRFYFTYTDGKLMFDAGRSSDFRYIDLPDGAEFTFIQDLPADD